MTLTNPQLQWRPTQAAQARRHDDIWFLDADTGWAVNSDGKILTTGNGGASWQEQFHAPDVYLRCVAFSSAQQGWVGTTTPTDRLYETHDGGQTWSPGRNLPAAAPAFICGLAIVNESVIYAAGTNDPRNIPGVIKSTDGGRTWAGWDMRHHASLLVDIYFPEPDRGWVVGGKADEPPPVTRSRVKPVVLYTEDGGQTWDNVVAEIQADFPQGEWGWKIFFVNDTVGYISLENFSAGAVLRTTDGGKTWARKVVNDQQRNANLEGLGFVNETSGWVGGWGDKFFQGGFSSATVDGGNNWRDANEIGRFINRFRFIGNPITVGYAAGDTIYKYSADPVPTPITLTAAPTRLLAPRQPDETDRPMEIAYTVPPGAKRLAINIWDRFGVHVCKLVDEQDPQPGAASVTWHCQTDSGAWLPPGYYIYRITIDNDSESRVIRVKS
jgi:photosystem II stability/assembly factor-like uncharacterized protein